MHIFRAHRRQTFHLRILTSDHGAYFSKLSIFSVCVTFLGYNPYDKNMDIIWTKYSILPSFNDNDMSGSACHFTESANQCRHLVVI